MDCERALRSLPRVHEELLRLIADGSTVPDVAGRLGIPPEAVGPLVTVALEKLRSLLARSGEDANGNP